MSESGFGKRVNRRALLGAGVVGVTGILVAACGSSSPVSSAQPTSAASAPAAPQPTSGSGAKPAATAATTAKPVTITVASDWNSGVRKDTIDAVVKEFPKENPNITVQALHMGAGAGTSSVGGLSEQIIAQFISGNAPDLIFGWIEIVGTYENYLADLTPLLKDKDFSKLGIVDIPFNTQWQGKQYGINFAPATGGWLYNIDMFEKAGVEQPTDAWTWDDAVAAFQKLTNPAQKTYGFWAQNSTEYGYLPMVMTNGGSEFTDNFTKVSFDDPKGLEAFQWWIDLIYKYKVSPGPGVAKGMGTADTSDLFQLGLVAVSASPFQSVGNQAKFIGDRFKWGLMPYPRSPRTNDRRFLIHTEPLVVSRDTQKRGTTEAALDLGLFFAGSDFAQKFIAENRPTIPVKEQWFNSAEYLKPPPENMKQIGVQLKDVKRQYQTRPLVKWYGEFTQKLTAAADKAFIGEATAEQAWKQAAADCQAVIDHAQQ